LFSCFSLSFFCYLLYAFHFFLTFFLAFFCHYLDKIQRLPTVEFKSKYLSVESNCTRVCGSLISGFRSSQPLCVVLKVVYILYLSQPPISNSEKKPPPKPCKPNIVSNMAFHHILPHLFYDFYRS
jgi:hypothetical protein